MFRYIIIIIYEVPTQRWKKDRWSTTTLFLVTKFFNERGKLWNGKTKQMQKNGGIIIPVSDFKVTVDKSIAYSEARTKLFAKKAQRSRRKVQCDTEIRLVSEKFPTASWQQNGRWSLLNWESFFEPTEKGRSIVLLILWWKVRELFITAVFAVFKNDSKR